jgi:CHASE2 domain-containing sensor protein
VIITAFIWLFIVLLNSIRLNLHFLDPFNNGLKDYELTDIVTARFRDPSEISLREDIVLINSGKPDRKVLQKMIDRIQDYQPTAMGIDILLEGQRKPTTDTVLANTLAKYDNIVLATRLINYQSEQDVFQLDSLINPLFIENSAALGYINFISKDLRTVRWISSKESTTKGEQQAFSVLLAQHISPQAVADLNARKNAIERINYRTPQDYFVTFDYSQVLDSTVDLTYLKNKIVLIGYLGDDEWSMPMRDRFFTPMNKDYTGKSLPDMYGLVIHANIIAMILDRAYIYEVPNWFNRLLEILFCYFNVILIHWVYRKFPEPFHGITRGIQIVEFILVFLLISVLFHYFDIRLDFGTGIFALVLIYDFVMIYESLIKNKIKWLQRLT